MPFIAPQDRTKPVELKVKIRPEVLALAKEYAEFLNSDLDYVVQEALRKLESDKEFQAVRKGSIDQSDAAKRSKAVA